ncbi:MAG: hypothetical protein F4Z89_11030 [Acidimicrobiaceae bacterium]|nr:hypothetical protein [Acidimicrobiaceae bacterium]
MSTGKSNRKKRIRGLRKVHGGVLLDKQLGFCGLCWEVLDSSYSVDHIKPLGVQWTSMFTDANALVNLQATHWLCNQRKGDSAMWLNRYLLEAVFLWRAHGSHGGPLNALEFLVCLPELRISAVNVSWGYKQGEGEHFIVRCRNEVVLTGDDDTISLFCQHATKIPTIPYESISGRMDRKLVPSELANP